MFLVAVFSQVAVDVTGKWPGTLTPPGRNEQPALLVLQQKGDTVTGTAGPNENERYEISGGKVVGDLVTFSASPGGRSMKFELTIKGDEMTGQVSLEGQPQTASFSVKRAK
jgi:hypothetical protein